MRTTTPEHNTLTTYDPAKYRIVEVIPKRYPGEPKATTSYFVVERKRFFFFWRPFLTTTELSMSGSYITEHPIPYESHDAAKKALLQAIAETAKPTRKVHRPYGDGGKRY